jgi:hypothetical protein
MTTQDTLTASEEMKRALSDATYVRITNSTNEKVLVYGPKREIDGGDYDSSWYILHPNQTTPSWWECNGIFIPRDRKFSHENGEAAQGPCAVRYREMSTTEITISGDQYIGKGDIYSGIFRENEISWPVPNFSSGDCQGMSRKAFEIPI